MLNDTNILSMDIANRTRLAIKRIDDVVGLHEPFFMGNEKTYLNQCIDEGFVSYLGRFVGEFEKKICHAMQCKYAVAVSNGTVALQMACLAAGVKPNDEILMPTMSFIASANAVSHVGAIPHFIDSEPDNLGIDPQKLRQYLKKIYVHGKNKQTGRNISAIMPVHIWGCPSKMTEICAVAEEFNLPIIEDSAEAIGARLDREYCGSFGKVSALSFNGNKIITTGGGGAVITNDEKIYNWVRHITTTAKLPHKWHFIHDKIGYNHRMPNINAAMGVAQMENLSLYLIRKQNLFASYKLKFAEFQYGRIFEPPADCYSNHWLIGLILHNYYPLDDIFHQLDEMGIKARPLWGLLHQQEPYKNHPRCDDLSCAIDLSKRVINLPSSVFLGT